MTPKDNIVIPISPGELFQSDPVRAVQGGNTRMVPLVPIGNGRLLPCIWKSHEVTTGNDPHDQPIRVHQCLLLVSREPLLTLRAEVEVEAWKQFTTGPIEW